MRLVRFAFCPFAAASFGGCSRDPEVMEQRSLDFCEKYSERGRYNEASILAETDTDLDIALTSAQRAKAAAPRNADFTDTLGLVYLKRGLSDEAAKVLAPIVAERPQGVDYRTRYAEALLRGGDREHARRKLETPLKSDPSPEDERRIRRLLSGAGS